jgi:tape measure domain-containing protein
MALSDINIRIGAEITQFQAGLRRAERELQRSADKFNQLGNNLSLALSLPLAAAGVSALKAAGDIEALRLGFEATMTGAGKSTAEATAELKALQKAAESPGLDFEQAVKGSIRLQNVGFEAEKSRKILSELANAVSLTGGNAQQLDGVTKQLAQMQGKGRILQEDLSILVENMPILSKVMKETFGTSNAEGLRKLGISTEEFILKTTEGLAKLERVPGGLNNAFTNAGVSIKLALGNVGESINKAFDVTGKLEAFSTLITDLASSFSALDTGTQKLIVGLGLAAAAAGPLFKLIGGSIETFKVAQSAFLSFGKAAQLSQTYFDTLAPSVGNLRGALGAAGVAWRALDTVAKATVIGAALAVVIALGVAFSNLSESMSTAGRVQASLNAVQNEAQKSIVAERLEAERLTGILASNTASYEQKKDALAKLNQIAPEYFKGLSIEGSSIDQINSAYKRYIDSLLTAARIKAAEGKLVELEKRKLDLIEAQNKAQQKSQGRLLAETAINALAPAGATAGSGFQQLGNIKNELDKIEAEQQALAKIAASANQANANLKAQAVATAGAPLGITGAALPTGDKTKKKEPAKFDGFKDIKSGLVIIEDQAALTNGELTALSTTIGAVLPESNNALAVAMAYTAENFTAARDAALLQEEALARVATQMQTVASLGAAVGDAIFQASADGAASLADLAKAGANAARSFIAQQIAMGIAAQVRAAFGTGLGGLLLAPILGGAAAALFNKLIPKFAEGGIITGPTYGLIGEAGPEVVFPLSDLKKFVGESGGGGGLQVYGRLYGGDILLSNERSAARRAQRRGF